MKNLLQFFTWWNGSTWGTRFYLSRNGTSKGFDAFGNEYFIAKDGQRYVQYAGETDPSSVPAGWSGWLHYRTDLTPDKDDYVVREWEQAHKPNMTGTSAAYRPKGSILNTGERPEVIGDYEAWTP